MLCANVTKLGFQSFFKFVPCEPQWRTVARNRYILPVLFSLGHVFLNVTIKGEKCAALLVLVFLACREEEGRRRGRRVKLPHQ